MRKFVLSTVALAAVVVMSTSVSAATLTLFQTDDLIDFGGLDTFDTPSTVGAGVTSSNLALGPGVFGQNWPDTLDANGFFGNTDLATALANNDYAGVTVTADGANTVDYTNFHVVLGVNVGTAVGDNQISLLASTDGTFGAGNLVATLEPTTPTNGVLTNTTFDIPLSLTGVGGSVEFRLYYSKIGNRVGIGAPFNVVVIPPLEDSLRIDGTVNAIPEPSSLALFGIALLSAVAMRRKK